MVENKIAEVTPCCCPRLPPRRNPRKSKKASADAESDHEDADATVKEDSEAPGGNREPRKRRKIRE